MKLLKLGTVVLILALSCPAATFAGPDADALGRCLVESTSQRDRLNLVRWMFAAASLHPAVKEISSVSPEQLDASNKIIADLIVELLTESCRTETEAALQSEGTSTLETAFSVLGQVAGQELFASPEVSAGMAGLQEHLDAQKLQSLVGPG